MTNWQDKNGHKLFAYERIKRLDLEFNNTCFLFCGGCTRTFNPKIEAVGKQLISLENIKEFFPAEFCQQLDYFLSCGTYGEPTAHPDCLEILQWFRINGVKNIAISTNGASRSPEWWSKLATITNGEPYGHKGGRVTFSIDGLADTNYLYRVGARWPRIIENAKAFIKAGGRARWQFIIMNHNEHQIDEAREMAKELGFSEFVEKTSFRFVDIKMDRKHAERLAGELEMSMLLEKKDLEELQDGSVLTNKNVRKSPIEPSSDPKNVHPNRKQIAKMHDSFKTKEDYFTHNPEIKCQNKGDGRIYVSFNGKIWPCSWMGGAEYFNDNEPHWPLKSLTGNNIDDNFNSLYNYKDNSNPVKEILSHKWFTEILEQDWDSAELCPIKCKQMCYTEIGDGAFEKARRNEVNLKTGKVKSMVEIHGLEGDKE